MIEIRTNKKGGTLLTSTILLIAFTLIAVTAASLLIGESGEITEQDVEQIAEETLDEISTYIQIKDKIGKYHMINNNRCIKQIALLIKPFFSTEIDLTDLTLQISDGEHIRMLYNHGNAQFIDSESLFEHPIWNNLENNNYACIVTLDHDESLLNYNVLNDNTDTTYIIFNVPDGYKMKKGESLSIKLFPSTGIVKTIVAEASFSTKPIITL